MYGLSHLSKLAGRGYNEGVRRAFNLPDYIQEMRGHTQTRLKGVDQQYAPAARLIGDRLSQTRYDLGKNEEEVSGARSALRDIVGREQSILDEAASLETPQMEKPGVNPKAALGVGLVTLLGGLAGARNAGQFGANALQGMYAQDVRSKETDFANARMRFDESIRKFDVKLQSLGLEKGLATTNLEMALQMRDRLMTREEALEQSELSVEVEKAVRKGDIEAQEFQFAAQEMLRRSGSPGAVILEMASLYLKLGMSPEDAKAAALSDVKIAQEQLKALELGNENQEQANKEQKATANLRQKALQLDLDLTSAQIKQVEEATKLLPLSHELDERRVTVAEGQLGLARAAEGFDQGVALATLINSLNAEQQALLDQAGVATVKKWADKLAGYEKSMEDILLEQSKYTTDADKTSKEYKDLEGQRKYLEGKIQEATDGLTAAQEEYGKIPGLTNTSEEVRKIVDDLKKNRVNDEGFKSAIENVRKEGYGYDMRRGDMKGIDCSEFTCKVWRDAKGVDIGANSNEQFRKSVSVAKRDAQIGDLVFFQDQKPSASRKGLAVHHVGIISGFDKNGNIIMDHQSSAKGGQQTIPLDKYIKNTGRRMRFVGIRRPKVSK